MDKVTKNSRFLWVDMTRIIAIIAVIANHTVAQFLFDWNKISIINWWVSDFYGAVIRFAVPVFLILSGYLLLDKQEDDKIFFFKRFYKVVIPLIAWSIIFMIYKTNYNASIIFSAVFIKEFLDESIYYHLYFLYIILGLYIITPLLRRILLHASMRDIYYYLIMWVIFTPIVQLFITFGYNIVVPVEAATGYLGYYILGYIIKKEQITSKRIYISGILAVISLMGTVVGTYIMTSSTGQLNNSFTNGLTITIVIYSSCIFILLREILSRLIVAEKWQKTIVTISGATMGIYLIHPIFLSFILNGVFGVHLLSEKILSPIISVPLVTLLLFVLSLMSVLILQKIPLVKIIVP
jgi:surface polysaccharide O-acyltransferase-like enzyme